MKKKLNLPFVRIPAGEYNVGYSENDKHLTINIKYPYVKPKTTPCKTVKVKTFEITKEPIRYKDLFVIKDFIKKPDKTFLNLFRNITLYDENDYVLVEPEIAEKIAVNTNTSLPRWHEWEIAMRGRRGYLYPWGNTLDITTHKVKTLTEKYSVDTESTMGYYDMSESVSFINSFGTYKKIESPFGLIGIAIPGAIEWNKTYKSQPYRKPKYMLRSICDLGAMTLEVPGIRPGTYGYDKYKNLNPFSGPILPCYENPDLGISIIKRRLFPKASFRLIRY